MAIKAKILICKTIFTQTEPTYIKILSLCLRHISILNHENFLTFPKKTFIRLLLLPGIWNTLNIYLSDSSANVGANLTQGGHQGA